jgi:hypothetical protein
MLFEIPRKSLPEIAKTVGLKDSQFPSPFFERWAMGCKSGESKLDCG